LPVFVAAFYGGMIVIGLLAYPMLLFGQGWLRWHGILALVPRFVPSSDL
jgi:hypothetical protein